VYNYLSSIIQKGAKNTINVTNDTFLSKSLIVPIDKVEQQKIADCLSSLDELINAENQKLEALQQHKKGLLQQLFPAEGEKIPKVRFREFKDCGEWEETELGQLGQLISGLTYSPEDVRSNGLLVLRSSNIKNSQIVLEDCVFVSQELKGANLTAPNDILICVRNGSKSLIGKNALLPNNLPFSTHGAFMTVFRANNPKFVFQLFQSGLFKKQVDADLGATINSINGSQLVKYKFTTPMPNEQKRIADFLSSVDRLILAQGTKVEKLKSHKKGLMQQLFPNMN
jgi:type I restriction enzyme S subunit